MTTTSLQWRSPFDLARKTNYVAIARGITTEGDDSPFRIRQGLLPHQASDVRSR